MKLKQVFEKIIYSNLNYFHTYWLYKDKDKIITIDKNLKCINCNKSIFFHSLFYYACEKNNFVFKSINELK